MESPTHAGHSPFFSEAIKDQLGGENSPPSLPTLRVVRHPMEAAKGYKRILALTEPTYTIEQIAAKVGKTPVYIATRLKLTELCDEVAAVFYSNPLEAVTNLLYLSRQNAINPDGKQWLDQAAIELRRISIVADQTLRCYKQSTKPQSITRLSLFSTTLNLYESRLNNAAIKVRKEKKSERACRLF